MTWEQLSPLSCEELLVLIKKQADLGKNVVLSWPSEPTDNPPPLIEFGDFKVFARFHDPPKSMP